MKCKFCGKEVMDKTVVCPFCGCQLRNFAVQQNIDYNDTGSAGWWWIGFLFWEIGLIFYMCIKGNQPNNASRLGWGIFTGIIVTVVILFFALLIIPICLGNWYYL